MYTCKSHLTILHGPSQQFQQNAVKVQMWGHVTMLDGSQCTIVLSIWHHTRNETIIRIVLQKSNSPLKKIMFHCQVVLMKQIKLKIRQDKVGQQRSSHCSIPKLCKHPEILHQGTE